MGGEGQAKMEEMNDGLRVSTFPSASARSAEAGFSLLETLAVMGLGLTLLWAVMERGSQTRAQLSNLNLKLRTGDVESQILTVFAGTNVGSQALRNFVGASPPPVAWPVSVDDPPFPSVEDVKLVSASASGEQLQCPLDGLSGPLTPAQKIPVDALYLGGPFAVKGLPLKLEPKLKLDDLYLTQLGVDGQCPSRVECRQKPCKFKLNVQLSSVGASGASIPLPAFSVPLHCSTRALASAPAVDILDRCTAREVVFPTPTPTATMCVGDVNQDGVTDWFDMRFLERMWGAVPSAVSGTALIGRFDTPSGVMEWVAAGGTGGFPNPLPSPTYSASYFNALRAIYKKADISPAGGNDLVNGDDLGVLLGDWGCRIDPAVTKPCFKDTPLYHLYARAAAAAKPDTVLDAFDRSEFEYCARAASIAPTRIPKCAGLNLDFKCDKTANGGAAPGSYCRLEGATTAAEGTRVVGKGDLEVLDFLLMMSATISRFNQDSRCNPPGGGWDPRKPPKYPNNWSDAKAPPVGFGIIMEDFGNPLSNPGGSSIHPGGSSIK